MSASDFNVVDARFTMREIATLIEALAGAGWLQGRERRDLLAKLRDLHNAVSPP